MVDQEFFLALLKHGDTISWNRWRSANPQIQRLDLSGINLRGGGLPPLTVVASDPEETHIFFSANLHAIDFNGADLGETQFANADLRFANLRGAKFDKAMLSEVDFRQADLSKVNFHKANLWKANFGEANLSEATLSEAVLSEANFSRSLLEAAFFFRADLADANFENANPHKTVLVGSWLSRARFRGANLREANLIAVQAREADFTGAILTGACLQDWNIGSETKLDDVICEYVYLKLEQQERRPRSGNFAPGEFAALFQKALETVDLIFADGIDWQAFFQSFQELRSQYGDLSIQAIEKKSGGAFIIRLEVPPEANKAAIERHAKELYEMKLRLQEERYRVELNAKDREIKIYKQQSARMNKIVELLASKEEPKVSLRPEQLKILQSVNAGVTNSDEISETTGISIDLAKYYIRDLQAEEYLQCSEYNDGISIDNNYLCHITSKGRVAITNPDLLLPLKHPVASQTTIHAQTVGAIHSGSGDITGFTMNINSNIDDITNLITSLREMAQTFPEAQREEVLEHLEDVEEGIRQPDKVKPHRIKAALAALLTIAGMVAATMDFSNNVLEIGNKLGIELIQTHLNQQLPPSK